MDEDFELYDGALSGPQIDALAQLDTTLPAIESSIAIVANGNTAPQNITAGQYVYVKNHSSLAEGLYYNKSGSTIASGTTLTSSNLGAVSNGVANELKSAFDTRNNITSDVTITPASGVTINTKSILRWGRLLRISVGFTLSSAISQWGLLMTFSIYTGTFYPVMCVQGAVYNPDGVKMAYLDNSGFRCSDAFPAGSYSFVLITID